MATVSKVCDGCDEVTETLEVYCANCDQAFCHDCTLYHRKLKSTRIHILVDASHDITDLNLSSVNANCGNDCGEPAVSLCIDCKQLLCTNCTNKHSSLKATKHHIAIAAKQLPIDETISVVSDRQCVSSNRRSLAFTQHRDDSFQAQVQDNGPFRGQFANELMSSAPADKEVTRVRGIAILSDGKIVVADYKNRSLKLFKRDLKFEMARELKDDPRGIASTPNDLIAVTIADKKEIRIFRIDNKIRTYKTFKVKEKPYSIAYHKEHFAVESGEGEDGAIRIYELGGKELFVIPGNTRSFGQFTGNTIRLALDFVKKTVFVVDIVNESIHSVDFKGNLCWSVKVRSPRGIVMFNNILFVASSEVNRIYQMNTTDGLIYHLLDEDSRVKRPRYIAYQPELKILAAEIDGNHVKLYNIEKLGTK